MITNIPYPRVVKRTEVPSKSEPGENHIVKEYSDGVTECDCVGFGMRKECRHVRIAKGVAVDASDSNHSES